MVLLTFLFIEKPKRIQPNELSCHSVIELDIIGGMTGCDIDSGGGGGKYHAETATIFLKSTRFDSSIRFFKWIT